MAEYIEREKALECLKIARGYCSFAYGEITRLPAADVAPVRHGRWEECDYVEPCIHGFGTIRHKNAGLKCTNCVHVFKKIYFGRITTVQTAARRWTEVLTMEELFDGEDSCND